MDNADIQMPENADYSPAIPLEISNELAEKADDLLRNFAEDVGLETALVVDRSGALVSGISSEPEVTIEVISALVAGASGAMRALISQFGETGKIESIHQGGQRLLYLRELIHNFILVGVSSSSLAPGIVREKANQIQGDLEALLQDVKPAEVAPPVPEAEQPVQPPRKSLREVAMERRAERMQQSEGESVVGMPVAPGPPPIPHVESVSDAEPEVIVEEEDLELPPPVMEAGGALEPLPELQEPDAEETDASDVEFADDTVVVLEDPKEILEPLVFDEPEVVIEDSESEEEEDTPSLPVDPSTSPFELEFDETEEEDDVGDLTTVALPEEGPAMEERSIFQFDDEEEEEAPEATPPALGANPFEVEDEEPEEESLTSVFEEEKEELVFELDDENSEKEHEEMSALFELDDSDGFAEEEDDELTQGPEIPSSEDSQEVLIEEESEDEEAEVKSSGPFYF